MKIIFCHIDGTENTGKTTMIKRFMDEFECVKIDGDLYTIKTLKFPSPEVVKDLSFENIICGTYPPTPLPKPEHFHEDPGAAIWYEECNHRHIADRMKEARIIIDDMEKVLMRELHSPQANTLFLLDRSWMSTVVHQLADVEEMMFSGPEIWQGILNRANHAGHDIKNKYLLMVSSFDHDEEATALIDRGDPIADEFGYDIPLLREYLEVIRTRYLTISADVGKEICFRAVKRRVGEPDFYDRAYDKLKRILKVEHVAQN